MNEEQIKTKFNKNQKDVFTIRYPSFYELRPETITSKNDVKPKANEQSSFIENLKFARAEVTKNVELLMKEIEELEAKRSALLERLNDTTNLINSLSILIEKHMGGKQ